MLWLGEAVSLLERYCQVNTTSSAVNALPSDHLASLRSFQVTEVKSFATPPFSTVGLSAARPLATGFASGPQEPTGQRSDGCQPGRDLRPVLGIARGQQGVSPDRAPAPSGRASRRTGAGRRGGADRPNRPVSRILSRTVISLERRSPSASSDLPGDRAGHTIVP